MCDGLAVGLVSFNYYRNDNYPDKPNVYTDISKYCRWIDEVLRQNPNPELLAGQVAQSFTFCCRKLSTFPWTDVSFYKCLIKNFSFTYLLGSFCFHVGYFILFFSLFDSFFLVTLRSCSSAVEGFWVCHLRTHRDIHWTDFHICSCFLIITNASEDNWKASAWLYMKK